MSDRFGIERLKQSVLHGVLCLMTLFALTTPSAHWAGATEGGWLPLGDDLRVHRLDEGLWLHASDAQWGENTVEANGLIVQGSEGVALLDTPWTDAQTARLLDWIAKDLEMPVVAVVGSHFHPDAFGGAAEAHRRGIETWGHTSTGELARDKEREGPKRTVEERHRLSLGDQHVELVHFGPGHSPDGLMAWLPERRVLYGGCAVKAAAWSSAGYLGDADLESWPRILEAAAETFDAEMVIPGHGPPGGPELLSHTIELVRAAADAESP